MRSRVLLFVLCLFLASFVTSCNKPPSDNSADTAASGTPTPAQSDKDNKVAREHKEHKEAKREPLVVPSGTEITISLGSAIGSKLSQPGQTFTGSIARDVMAGSIVAIRKGRTSAVQSRMQSLSANSRAERSYRFVSIRSTSTEPIFRFRLTLAASPKKEKGNVLQFLRVVAPPLAASLVQSPEVERARRSVQPLAPAPVPVERLSPATRRLFFRLSPI